MGKLAFTERGADLLSYGEFYDLYEAYKKVFDEENILRYTKTTYYGLNNENNEQEEIAMIDFEKYGL